MKEVAIYSDGACSNNPGIGGWGAILIYKNVEKEVCGAEELTTNNRMEMTAAIEALKCLNKPCIVSLYTDSSYLSSAFTEGWIYKWLKNGWKTSGRTEVLNRDLWTEILELIKPHKVTWIRVKGHSDNPYNNRCDALARNAVRRLKAELEKQAEILTKSAEAQTEAGNTEN